MKLWGGRFQKASDRRTEEFNASIGVDQRMYRQDIKGSQAHARMLAKQGILTVDESEQIIHALTEILAEIEAGKLEFTIEAEDIHMNIETFLIAKIGDVGKKLHTARSRNDQVALDLRLYLRDEIKTLHDLLLDTIHIFLQVAKAHQATILPGYTHLQKAQPITLGHYMLAYVEMFRRDVIRLNDVYAHTGMMPLGSGALAGTGFPLDRSYVAQLLQFDAITLNSLDGVSDRDFALEFLSMASILMMHLSRFCEELILWSSDEFKFVELDDAFTTGSSIMPQKKNPDLAELIRGKTGRVYGDLMTLLTIMKGLPLAYNKDMQEDKEAIFDAVDTVEQCLLVLGPMVETARYQPVKMLREAKSGFTNATDLADYLVEKGVPFRDAHAIVGRAVILCLEQQIGLEDLSLSAYQELNPLIGQDIYTYIAVEACVERRKVPGGPAREAVADSIRFSEKWLKTERKRYYQ